MHVLVLVIVLMLELSAMIRSTNSSCKIDASGGECAPAAHGALRAYESGHRCHRERATKSRHQHIQGGRQRPCPYASCGRRQGTHPDIYWSCDWTQRPWTKRNIYRAPHLVRRRRGEGFSIALTAHRKN